MAHSRVPTRHPVDRTGFTLVELLLSLVIGMVVVGASLSFAVTTFRGAGGNRLREEVYRNARFIGMSLERDLQTTGVGIESEIRFGTLSTFSDTLVALHVPWDPTSAYPYEISSQPGTNNPLDPGGTCGSFCIDFDKDPGGAFDLTPGDIARLQIVSERRIILVTDVVDNGSSVELTFAPDTLLLHFEAAFAGGVQLDRFGTIVQKLQPILYWVEGETLYRSDQLDSNGDLIAAPLAYGVKSWDAKMIFVDLDEADEGDPNDTDFTNDFDDILGTRITAVLGTDRPDLRVAGGGEFTRDYEWRITPRNLMYERNR